MKHTTCSHRQYLSVVQREEEEASPSNMALYLEDFRCRDQMAASCCMATVESGEAEKIGSGD